MFNYSLFSKRLHSERILRELTIESLSQLTGLPTVTLLGHESQSQIIVIEELVKIADTFEISLDYLIGISKNRKIDG